MFPVYAVESSEGSFSLGLDAVALDFGPGQLCSFFEGALLAIEVGSSLGI
jgi:hypothetical protein